MTTGGGTAPPPGETNVIVCPDYDPGCTEEKADDEVAECKDLGCELRDPTEAELARIMELINRFRTDGFCAEVRQSALAMVNRQVLVWDNMVKYTNGKPLFGAAPWDYSRGGHVMYIWTGALTAWTIAHEAIHGIWNPNTTLGNYYTHTDITPVGLTLDETAGYCSGN